jgi:hypothetical protein
MFVHEADVTTRREKHVERAVAVAVAVDVVVPRGSLSATIAAAWDSPAGPSGYHRLQPITIVLAAAPRSGPRTGRHGGSKWLVSCTSLAVLAVLHLRTGVVQQWNMIRIRRSVLAMDVTDHFPGELARRQRARLGW